MGIILRVKLLEEEFRIQNPEFRRKSGARKNSEFRRGCLVLKCDDSTPDVTGTQESGARRQ